MDKVTIDNIVTPFGYSGFTFYSAYKQPKYLLYVKKGKPYIRRLAEDFKQHPSDPFYKYKDGMVREYKMKPFAQQTQGNQFTPAQVRKGFQPVIDPKLATKEDQLSTNPYFFQHHSIDKTICACRFAGKLRSLSCIVYNYPQRIA